jgi:5-methylthioribose kinase
VSDPAGLSHGVSGELEVVASADGEIVVKRALAKLRTAADWRSDPARSAVEADCLQVLGEILPRGTVPRVLWVDKTRHAFGMERLPAHLRPWKDRLLAGEIDMSTANRVGDLLGRIHSATAARSDLARRFDDRRFLFELRIRPFHERVAERCPDLAPPIASVVDRMLADRRCLVHGDYSPKNLLTDGTEVAVLDCEVAHWGDPRFDIGFCLAHLVLKLIKLNASVSMVDAIGSYLEGYATTGLRVLDAELSRATACIVLARIVGDSPVDYLTEPSQRQTAMQVGRSLLLDPPHDPRHIPQAVMA